MRSNYWSCSKFADWLRGTAKLTAGTAEEWREWYHLAKTAHGFRYWLAEKALGYLQNFVYYIPDKIHNVKYYINNRWVTRTHALTAHTKDISPGEWCDTGNRFLPCLFNELVNFVEIEQAWNHCLWDEEARKKYQPPWWRSGWLRWRTWRCPEAGLDALRWAATLVYDESCGINPGHPDYGQPTPQAQNAIECINLYLWWTELRPKRPDPHDVSGWKEYCESLRDDGKDIMDMVFDSIPNDQNRKRNMLDISHELDQRYLKEDEDMMIRLIKLRNYLWT